MVNRRVVAIAAAGVMAFFGASALVRADHAWAGYHWSRSSNPVPISLGDNLSGLWPSVLDDSSADWNNPVGSWPKVIHTVVGFGLTNPRNCKPVSGTVQVCNGTYGNNGWLGVAQIWVSGSHIQQGTVRVNDTYFFTPSYDSAAWRQFVMCQEVGHTFGLDHQDEAFNNLNMGSCMDYTDDPARNDGDGNNLHPNNHDFEELALIYSHLDGESGGGGGSGGRGRGAGPAGAPGASEFGQLVRDNGHEAVFVHDLGDGSRVISFVLRANR